VAYIAQGSVNLSNILDSIGLDSVTTLFPGIDQIIFAGTAGSLMYFARPQMMEKINTFLVVAMMATFIGIVGIAARTTDFHSLIAPVNQHPDQVVNALPILFLSLVYQNVVPTVVKNLEGDRRKIQKAIIGGTFVPLVMFLVWNAVILGNVYATGAQDAMAAGALDPIAMLQGAGQGGGALGPLFEGFSEVAITTSLIGFVYSLLDAITDVTGLPSEGSRFERFKPLLFGAVFIPPFALSLASPDIFYDALDLGGAFGVSTLFLLLPGIMVWKERYGDEQGPISTKAMVPGGKITLGSLWKTAGVLIFEQGAEKLGVFDFIRDIFS
jgi:tyrosine-specific transport protein